MIQRVFRNSAHKMFYAFYLQVAMVCLGVVHSSPVGSFFSLPSNLNPVWLPAPVNVRNDFAAAPRSWTPRGSIVFPPSSNTNAGQLNYQLQDTAKFKAEIQAARPPKALQLQDTTNFQPSKKQSDSSFRPSPEYPITLTDDSIKEKREYFINSPQQYPSSVSEKSESPIKSTRYIIETITPSPQPVEITQSPLISDYADLVDAMEHLVERLNELETQQSEDKRNKETVDENTRSIYEMNTSLKDTKEKLEADIVALSGRTIHLEQRLSYLEEITREWIDPSTYAQDYDHVKSNGKRGAGRSCPAQFFSLDNTNPTAPCYFISTAPNYRKNWQDATTSCQEINAKLAEPKTTDELKTLTDFLRYNRTDQLGGGYWTGGLNPGLMWLWPTIGSSLTNIDPDMWIEQPDSTTETNSGKCLRLSYDRTLHRYALQGSDCQRYLYFVCEYDTTKILASERWEKSLPTTTTTPSTPSPTPSTTTPISHFTTRTIRPILWRTSTSATTRDSTSITTTLSPQPTPNYVGVIGFKGIPPKHSNANPLNLAVLDENNS